MPRGFTTDREAVVNYVKEYHDLHGKRPTQKEIAEVFGISQSAAGTIVRSETQMAGERIPGGRTPKNGPEEDRHVLSLLRRHILEHGWAPSQREISDETGFALHKVNLHMHRLHTQGLIELGPNPREVRIVGSKMVIPEVTM